MIVFGTGDGMIDFVVVGHVKSLVLAVQCTVLFGGLRLARWLMVVDIVLLDAVDCV